MTPQSTSLMFPSLEFFQALANRMNSDEQKYRSIGLMDLYMGITITPDGPLKSVRQYAFLFDGFGCDSVEEISVNNADVDFTIIGAYSAWQEMFQSIQLHGKAGTTHTLNHLVMLEDPMRAIGPDQHRIDKLYRFNFSIQSFLDEAASLDIKFAT